MAKAAPSIVVDGVSYKIPKHLLDATDEQITSVIRGWNRKDEQAAAEGRTPATVKQIRKHYAERDMEVRISRDGHVRYRTLTPHRNDINAWLEGGYVDSYFIFENSVHWT